MSALENIHYGFEHHLKWLSPQIVHYLRVLGVISDTATDIQLQPTGSTLKSLNI